MVVQRQHARSITASAGLILFAAELVLYSRFDLVYTILGLVDFCPASKLTLDCCSGWACLCRQPIHGYSVMKTKSNNMRALSTWKCFYMKEVRTLKQVMCRPEPLLLWACSLLKDQQSSDGTAH